MKTITKTSLISLAVAAAFAAAPQAAFAHKAKKAHTHKKAAVHHAAAPVSSTDAKLRQLEAEIQALRGELGRTRTETKSAVAAVAEKANAQDAALEARLIEDEKHEKTHHDLLFFRGGYASMTHPRNDELLTGNTTLNGLLGTGDHNQGNGWYIGAGFDHRLTDNLWGLTDMAALDGEVMFQYLNFGQSTNTLVSVYPAPAANILTATAANPLGKPLAGRITNQITQFTLTASPKIKFNNLGDFRPWIIPVGLSINVISPPSSGVTVLNPGLMLGVGGEYRLWESLWAGIDFRYNFTGGDLAYASVGGVKLKGTSTDGLTAGGYLGFGF
jgi:hypothetical protein